MPRASRWCWLLLPTAVACAQKESEPLGELMVEISTDMAVPKDFDQVRVEVLVRGDTLLAQDYPVGPNRVLLPATLGLVKGARNDPVTIRVVSLRNDPTSPAVRTLREVITTVPSRRVARLPIPIQWLCDGSGKQVGEHKYENSICAAGQSCVAGACTDNTVDSTLLPEYRTEDVYGGGDGASGTCLDTLACFAAGQAVSVSLDDCSSAMPETSASLNVALVLEPGSSGICSSTVCLVPLDAQSPSGWQAAGARIVLPQSACQRIQDGQVLGVAVTQACPSKTESVPTCGAWSSVTATVGTQEATPPLGVVELMASGGAPSHAGGTTSRAGASTGGVAPVGGLPDVAGAATSAAGGLAGSLSSTGGLSLASGGLAAGGDSSLGGATLVAGASASGGIPANRTGGTAGAASGGANGAASGGAPGGGFGVGGSGASMVGGAAATGGSWSAGGGAGASAAGTAGTAGSGQLLCAADQTVCGIECVDLTSNPQHCGQCDVACSFRNAQASCVQGQCFLGACNSGFDNCDGISSTGCEADLLNDPTRCGSCVTSCTARNGTPTCSGGTCAILACSAPFADCDHLFSTGCETDTSGDVENCGACDQACHPPNATGQCLSSVCIVNCATNYRDCNSSVVDGCETNITNDVNHCGNCTTVCTAPGGTPNCHGGTCGVDSCSAPLADCDDQPATCETNTNVDPLNCGSCGVSCARQNATGACASGSCTLGSCTTGWADCDDLFDSGCEASLSSDAHCGSCTTDCTGLYPYATGICSGGTSCVMGNCSAGYANCDDDATTGCETAIAADPTHCGACQRICSTNHGSAVACTLGICEITCAAGWGNCDDDALSNGCESDLTVNPTHCGSCDRACAAGQSCVGGSCVDRPCTGLCSNPTGFTSLPYQSGNLGIGAACYETMAAASSIYCTGFASGRVLTVNGTAILCDSGFQVVPSARNGGYCIQTTAGEYSYATFNAM